MPVAGALGLRSVSPEGLVWLSSEAPPSWERHLVWGLPALVFVLIVSGLAWWAQDPGTGVFKGLTVNRPPAAGMVAGFVRRGPLDRGLVAAGGEAVRVGGWYGSAEGARMWPGGDWSGGSRRRRG